MSPTGRTALELKPWPIDHANDLNRLLGITVGRTPTNAARLPKLTRTQLVSWTTQRLASSAGACATTRHPERPNTWDRYEQLHALPNREQRNPND